MIGDPSVRKYYRQDLDERVRALFAPSVRRTDRAGAGKARPVRQQSRWQGKERGKGDRRPAPREVLGAPSARLATSQIVRGARSALPSREALILLAVINHPWLLETHAEDLAELEFRHADGDRLRARHSGRRGRPCADARRRCAPRSAGVSLARVLARVEASITHPSDWPAREGAAEEDVSLWWTHVVSLHRKSRTLHKELKDAELALGSEPSEENLAWLRDIQARLAALEGAEALIDGFGAPSGRPVRTF